MSEAKQSGAKRRHLFTVNELRAALDRLVNDRPETGDQQVLFEGDQFYHWNGRFYASMTKSPYVVMEPERDVWVRPGEIEGLPERLVQVVAETSEWVSWTAPVSEEPYSDRDHTDGRIDRFEARLAAKGAKASGGSSGPSMTKSLAVNVGHTVWVVAALYTSGDTFGRDGGQVQVLDVFDNPGQADALLKAAKDWDANGSRAEGWIQGALVHEGVSYYTSWTGYFESLDELRVWPAVVRGR